MKKILSVLILTLAINVFADGPVTQVSPFMRPVLNAPNSAAAQTALGFTGTVPLSVVTNIAASVPATLATNSVFSGSATNLNGLSAAMYIPVNGTTNHVAYFGAYPNGYVYDGISVTNLFLTCSTPCPGSPAWSSALIGQRIIINYAGNHGQYYMGIISNYFATTPPMLGLFTPVSSPLTNFAYAVICTTNSEMTNTLAIQSCINSSVSNGWSPTIILDPPSFFTQILGSNSVGQCYVCKTNWQFPTMNNAMFIVPPDLAGNTNAGLGAKNTVTIQGGVPYQTWGFGPGESYISFNPNQSVLVIDGTGNDVDGTNFIGNSVFDGRSFSHYENAGNGPNGLIIPCNDCALVLKNFSIFHSYDSHITELNLSGLADGATVENVSLVGGDAGSSINGQSYEFSFGNYPASTNSIGIIWPCNTQGTFGYGNYVIISGEWSAMEEGLCQGVGITAANNSNVVDFCYSSAIEMNLQLNLGANFNVNHVRNGVQQPPARLFENIIDFGNNTMPSGTIIQLMDDEYYYADQIHDGFSKTRGEITFTTNINVGVPLTWTNWNMPGTALGANGLLLKLYGQNGLAYLNGNQTFANVQMGTQTNTGSAYFGGQLIASCLTGTISIFIGAYNGLEENFISLWSRGKEFWRVGVSDIGTPDGNGVGDLVLVATTPGVGAYPFKAGMVSTNGDFYTHGSVIVSNNLVVEGAISNAPNFSQGLGSSASGALLFSTGGCTNTSNIDYQLIGVAGTYYLTNLVTHWGAPSGSIGGLGYSFILQPHMAVVGSVAEYTNYPF